MQSPAKPSFHGNHFGGSAVLRFCLRFTNNDCGWPGASRTTLVRSLEARGGIEPPIKVLQTFALPLGERATSPAFLPDRQQNKKPANQSLLAAGSTSTQLNR